MQSQELKSSNFYAAAISKNNEYDSKVNGMVYQRADGEEWSGKRGKGAHCHFTKSWRKRKILKGGKYVLNSDIAKCLSHLALNIRYLLV